VSTYPTSLDNLGATNPASSDPMNDGAGHAAQHAEANDAIDAIQATLGVDPQGGSADVATRLDDLAFADLADVDMSGISDGDVPVWNAAGSKFEPGVGGGGGGGGGGLVLIDSGTFSAVSSFSLPGGSFDGTYDDYFLDLVVSCSNVSPQVCRVRMRSSGSDDTTSNYNFQQNYTTGSSAGTSLDKGALLSIAGGKTAAKIQITSPALSEHTFLYDNYVYSSGAGAIESGFYATVHRVASAFDSLTVFPDGGSDTLTGRWALYGYAK